MSIRDQPSQSPTLTAEPFLEAKLVTLEHEGIRYVAMKRVVENMGLDWKSQLVKLRGQPAKFNCGDITMVGQDGAAREMVCMPIERLQIWLTTITPGAQASTTRKLTARPWPAPCAGCDDKTGNRHS